MVFFADLLRKKNRSIEAHGILVKGTAVYIEPGLLMG